MSEICVAPYGQIRNRPKNRRAVQGWLGLGKGVTLSKDELLALKELLNNIEL